MDTSTGNCPSDESISEFISGTLTTTVAGDIESHVEVCETCRATIERLSDERDGSDWRPLINPQGRQSAADRSDQIAMPVTRKIGRYELVSPIGRGGMGHVFLATSESGEQIALKLISSESGQSATHIYRIRTEADAMGTLRHPHIVPILDSGVAEGYYYIAMPRFRESLSARIKRGRPSPADAARYTIQIASAIKHAHEHLIVHRDLKPANVLLDDAGNAFVSDFGLARELDSDSGITLPGTPIGTAAYMSPEAARGERPTTLVDVYGLGAILYELLAGVPPYQGDNALDILHKINTTKLVPLSKLNPGVPADLEAICLKCLAKSGADRYPTANDVELRLKDFLEGRPLRDRPKTFVEDLAGIARRNPVVTGLATALLALSLFTVIVVGKSNAQLADSNTQLRSQQRVLESNELKLKAQNQTLELRTRQLEASEKELRKHLALLEKSETQTIRLLRNASDLILEDTRLKMNYPELQPRFIRWLKEELHDIGSSVLTGRGITRNQLLLSSLELFDKKKTEAIRRLVDCRDRVVQGYPFAADSQAVQIDQVMLASELAKAYIAEPNVDRPTAIQWLEKALTEAERLNYSAIQDLDPRVSIGFNLRNVIGWKTTRESLLADEPLIDRFTKLLQQSDGRYAIKIQQGWAKHLKVLTYIARGDAARVHAACVEGIQVVSQVSDEDVKFSPTFRGERDDLLLTMTLVRDTVAISTVQDADRVAFIQQRVEDWKKLKTEDATSRGLVWVATCHARTANMIVDTPLLKDKLGEEAEIINQLALKAIGDSVKRGHVDKQLQLSDPVFRRIRDRPEFQQALSLLPDKP